MGNTTKNTTVEFAGVSLVRVLKKGNKSWQVQMRDSETSEHWEDIGQPFATCKEAVDEAPYLCEF